jgi:hypothetical protein
MKKSLSTSRLLLAGIALLVACGDNLIQDPSFDLWCGAALCAPWEATGKVTRVGTWHSYDYGVALQDGAVLSQAVMHDAVSCIEFEVIADVDAKAEVWLEMDFRDDGSSEYKQLIPESHWAKLSYLVKAPSWYDKLRFILRKQGKGRAVLAQIKATPSEDCSGPAVALLHRPPGAGCESADQCDSAVCTTAPERYGPGLAKSVDGKPAAKVCSGCATDTECGSGERCGLATGDAGAHRACVTQASSSESTWCLSDAQCESGDCNAALPVTHAGCASCASDTACASGEVCGVSVGPGGAARECVEKAQRERGQACAVSAECKSGVCCQGTCSECCANQDCKNGKPCRHSDVWLTVTPSLCGAADGSREAGSACFADDDCHSGQCQLPKTECFLRCDAQHCGKSEDIDCGFVRQLAGVCR